MPWQRYETALDYLAAIVRDQLHLSCTGRTVYNTLRDHAAVEHVQYLMYTIINRGRSDARKMASETGQETYEPHADPRTSRPASWLIMSGLSLLSATAQLWRLTGI